MEQMTAQRLMDAGVDRPQTIARRNLYDEVVGRLRDIIVEGELEPGQRVPERELCDRFDISRTPLREALKVLASEGLVDLRPNRGAVVAPVSIVELEETVDVLAVIEGLAGGLAAANISDEGIAEVKAMHDQMVVHYQRGELSLYFRCNQAIHDLIIKSTGNKTLASTYASLNARIKRYRYLANLSQDRWKAAVAEHEEILAALSARDGKRLAKLLPQHLRNKCDQVRATLPK